jgi:chitin disaccharide deacetylase
MVAGPAAADAVERARRLPGLRVGLHLVLVEGPAVLPPERIPGLVGADGQFPSGQARLGVRYFFDPAVRRQLAAEIAAQYAAFAATGLTLGHADAHKHMHLHPTVGRLMIAVGLRHGLRRLRVPAEPPAVMASLGERTALADRLLHRWAGVLRRQARRAGLETDDHVFGLRWSGGMTVERVLRLLEALPPGASEIYFHPATCRNALLQRLMFGYQHEAEFDALIDGRVRDRLRTLCG